MSANLTRRDFFETAAAAAVGEHAFAIALPGGDGGSRISPQIILTFVNPMSDGRMGHVATGGMLYRRTK